MQKLFHSTNFGWLTALARCTMSNEVSHRRWKRGNFVLPMFVHHYLFKVFRFSVVKIISIHHQNTKHSPIGRFPLFSPLSSLHQSPFHPKCAFSLSLLIRLVKFCLQVLFLCFLCFASMSAVLTQYRIPNIQSFGRNYVRSIIMLSSAQCPLSSATLLRGSR